MRRRLLSCALVLLAVYAGCGGGGGGGTQPEPEPPVIVSGPSASDITAGAATIVWTTDKETDSKVRYGKTSSYTDSVTAGQMVTGHSLVLSDLEPLTRYHYRVVSQDADGLRVTSGDRTLTTASPVQELVGDGWHYFEDGQYDLALSRFSLAYGYEADNVDVLEGLGWTLLRQYSFDDSRSVLEAALSRDPDRLDCLVAAALVYHAIEQYSAAIDAANGALDTGGQSYVFSHDSDITAADVRYTLILALVATGDLTGALAEARVLDPSIDLDPDDPQTWNGHLTFEAALLVVIENLGSQV